VGIVVVLALASSVGIQTHNDLNREPAHRTDVANPLDWAASPISHFIYKLRHSAQINVDR
jgi:hypothetical protein